MANDFSIGLRRQEEWSWLVAIDLFFGGLGGGLFLFYGFLNLPIFMGFLSLGLVILGGLVLLVELGHPARAWRAIRRPSTSWISRGGLSVSLFFVFGFMLSSSPSIPFWNSPLLPVLFFSHSVMGAGGIVLLFFGESGAVRGVG